MHNISASLTYKDRPAEKPIPDTAFQSETKSQSHQSFQKTLPKLHVCGNDELKREVYNILASTN